MDFKFKLSWLLIGWFMRHLWLKFFFALEWFKCSADEGNLKSWRWQHLTLNKILISQKRWHFTQTSHTCQTKILLVSDVVHFLFIKFQYFKEIEAFFCSVHVHFAFYCSEHELQKLCSRKSSLVNPLHVFLSITNCHLNVKCVKRNWKFNVFYLQNSILKIEFLSYAKVESEFTVSKYMTQPQNWPKKFPLFTSKNSFQNAFSSSLIKLQIIWKSPHCIHHNKTILCMQNNWNIFQLIPCFSKMSWY